MDSMNSENGGLVKMRFIFDTVFDRRLKYGHYARTMRRHLELFF